MNKSLNLIFHIFHTKYAILKSSKVSHWLSKYHAAIGLRTLNFTSEVKINPSPWPIGRVTQPLHTIALDVSFLAGAHPESEKVVSKVENPKNLSRKSVVIQQKGGTKQFATLFSGGFPPKKHANCLEAPSSKVIKEKTPTTQQGKQVSSPAPVMRNSLFQMEICKKTKIDGKLHGSLHSLKLT